MAGDYHLAGDGASVRIEGLGRTLRALAKAGADAQDMRDAMHRLGMVVVTAARPRVPIGKGPAAGRTLSTLRAGRGKTKAVVRMGGARAPYAPVVHYGWPARNIDPQPSLVDAYQATRPRVLAQLDTELGQLLKSNRLK